MNDNPKEIVFPRWIPGGLQGFYVLGFLVKELIRLRVVKFVSR